MVEHGLWWPVALQGDGGAASLAVTVLGEPLLLWRDGTGAMQALADRCPHRGARLSLGAVVEGQLQCPYHGWRFDGSGRCRAIPALPALPPRRVVHGPFDVATSAPRAIENFLDTAHFAYVHDGWLGAPTHAEVPPYEVTLTADGRPVVPDYPAWQPRATARAQGGAWVRYRYEVLSPTAALLQKQPEGDALADAYVMWACPTTPESCRVWFVQHTTDTATPDEALRDFQAAIFAQDRPTLESQVPKRLPLSGGEAMFAADRLSAAYRRYLKACGITFGVC